MCRDAYSAIVGGITWSFSPLLPLQTDQVSKLNNFVNAPLIAINLDAYKGSHNRISKIATVLSSVTFKTPTSYIIFCSPQLITSSEVVMNMFRDHLKKKILNLVVVDEAHLIVQFGLYFRAEFILLKDSVFKELICNEVNTLAPVLFMTASATTRTIDLLGLMTNLSFTHDNCFWPKADGMISKKILVKFIYTSRPLQVFKNRIKRLYKDANSPNKWILFSNTRIAIDKYYDSVRSYLDSENYDGDIIKITGTMYREQKLYHTDLFLNMNRVASLCIEPTDGIPFDVSGFDARGCLATRSLGSAG